MSAPDDAGRGIPPPAAPPLLLRGRTLGVDRAVVMAVVNRTTDSFYSGARSFTEQAALETVDRAVEDGCEIVDVGGVPAGTGAAVGAAEEIRRVVPFVGRLRERHPDLLVSVDTWRAEVAEQACRAGADLVNDTWAGHDPRLAEVAARYGAGLVCSHTGGAGPRSRPYRVAYGPGVDGVLADVVRTLQASAARAVAAGVPPASVLVDPTHDFGKNTWHSLLLLRRTDALTRLGHPVLMALSRKDFLGETLGLPPEERLEATLAAVAVAAWLGARVFRVHDVRSARRVLDTVLTVRGERPPAFVIRALA